jgi:hypothetical protein
MAFPEGWNYYKEYDQPGTADGEQTGYQVDITVTHVTDKMRSDFGDVRFALEDGTELSYHLVSYTADTTALFVVEIPTLPITGITLRVWYGNASATTTSDPESVYDAYISGASDESSLFTLVDIYNPNINATLTYDSVNDYYKLKNETANDMIFAKINSLDGKADIKLKADIYRYSNTANDQGGLIGRKKASNTWVIGRYEVGVNKLDITQGLSGTYTEKDSDSYILPQNTWFTLELEIVGTVANLKWYNSGGTLIYSETTSTINAGIDTGDWGLAGGYNTNSERYFKNIIARKTTANPPAAGSFGSEVSIIQIGNAVASGLPIVMYNVPTGEAVATGLPVNITNWELLNIGNATASGLEIEKWFAYTPSFFIEDANGIILKDLSFESLYPGRKSEIQKLTVINNLEREMQMTLTPGASLNQLGSDLDTYLSHYSSLDGVDFSNQPLILTIPALGELDFYTYWQPSSNAKIGWKQWLYDLDLEGVPSLEGWGYVSWFTVTGTGVAIDIPYTLDEMVRIDYVHGLMKYDFADIRFALEDHTVLGYDLISKVDGDHAYFVVQLPEIPASPNNTIVYVYCGNPDAEDESDPTIHQLHNTFQGTSLNPEIWYNLTGLSYFTLNSYIDFVATGGGDYINGLPTMKGAQLQNKSFKPKSVFDIEFKIANIACSKYGICIGTTGLGLIRNDDTIIIFAGFEDIEGLGPVNLSLYNTEGVWTNVASGWSGEGTGNITKSWVNNDIINVKRNGNNISVYVNDVHVADTTITSQIYRVVTVNGIHNADGFSGWDTQRLYYLCEDEFVGQNLPIPIVGEVDPRWINIYPIPVKADILFQSRELPNNTPQQRFTAKIGGVLHQ